MCSEIFSLFVSHDLKCYNLNNSLVFSGEQEKFKDGQWIVQAWTRFLASNKCGYFQVPTYKIPAYVTGTSSKGHHNPE